MGTAIIPVQPYQETQLEDFRGPWSRLEATDVPPTQALTSLNAEYNPGQEATRNGFAALWNPAKAITSLFNWVKASDGVSLAGNYLILNNATDGKVQWVTNVVAPALIDLFTVSAEAVDPASSGNQLFLPTLNATNQFTPVGAAQCRIVGIYVAATQVDKAFLGPSTVKPVLANANVGSITAGSHFVGYVITTRNGYTGKINPVLSDGATPDQSSSIIAPGGKQITVSITETWPAEATSVTLIMTATTNPFQFFQIPGAVYGVPGGSPFTINAIIDISDAQLINNTNDLTNNQFFLTQTIAGAGPFSPWKVAIYGGRTVYMTYDGNGTAAIYISEIDNPQQLTEQFHKKRLPGFLKMASMFVLGRSLYVLGTNWTYSFQDNRGLPSTWSPAALTDGAIGTPSSMGVTVTASGDWSAVVHISGLYIFRGRYDDKPLSYYVDDQWRRINFAVPQVIRIADNHDKKQLLVAVPLDGATTPTHLMMFDYSDGLDYQAVKFSLWNLFGFNPRALCVFMNGSTGRQEFLIGKATAGKVLRQMNTTDDMSGLGPWTDDGAAINHLYEIGPQPTGAVGMLFQFVGMFLRVKGRGVMTAISYSLDHAKSVPWTKPITLLANPGVEIWRQFKLNAERCSTSFSTGAQAGDYMILSGIRQKFYQWAQRR
jgi:hypothetical protein